MIKIIVTIFCVHLCLLSPAQTDVKQTLKAADKLVASFNDREALGKYKEAFNANNQSSIALYKIVETNVRLGELMPDKEKKAAYFNEALTYAQKLYNIDSNKIEANIALATVYGKLTQVEVEKKKIVQFVRLVKLYADKGINIQNNNALILFIQGKWHLEMATLGWAKKLAVKALYGGLPEGNLDTAISYFERSKTIDPYLVINALTLAKAYKETNLPTKQIETLKYCLKLPELNSTDVKYKEEAKGILAEAE